MSKKQTSAESRNDEQTNEDSDSVPQKEDNVKRDGAAITSLGHTTLQDLPIELLECILVQAVAMEVKGMKLAKCVWREKVDPVISRLTTVCSQWSSILTTDVFENKVNRVLDESAQERSRLEILHQSPIQFEVSKVTTTKDEIFMLCSDEDDRDRIINVYDRNNMAGVKDVIQLPGNNPGGIAGCSVSSCVYVHYMGLPCGISIVRITKDEAGQFNISPWISDQELTFAEMSVSTIGSLIIVSNLKKMNPALVSIYDANGSLQSKIRLLPDVYGFKYLDSVIQKSNGNLVVVSAYNDQLKTKLTEINGRGRILRQYQSSLNGQFDVRLADIYGRIFITASHNRMELLDSELNLLDFAGPQLDKGQFIIPHRLHFNSARNEIVSVVKDKKLKRSLLTIFRLTED